MDAVVANNISKVFRLHEDRPASIKEHLLKFGRNPKRDFQALHPFDLTVPSGQTLGILGHNDDPVVPGAGSAVFLHVAPADGGPTAGCVALRPRDMARLLPRLARDARIIVQ